MTMLLLTEKVSGKLPDIYEKKNAFYRAFGGEPQIITGPEYSNKFLKINIDDADSVINDYSTDANVAMGSGTGNSSRLGEINEIKTITEEVEFYEPKAINEGVDKFTYNGDLNVAAAKRLKKHSEAWAALHEALMGEELSEKANKTLNVELTEASLIKAFNDAYATFVNNDVSDSVAWIAYVTAEVYSLIVDSNLAITTRGVNASVADQTVVKFKGFELEVVSDRKFKENEVAYFTVENVGAAAVALKEIRAMDDNPNFIGFNIQSAAKLGKHIPSKNSKAIVKAVTAGSATPKA